jgi:1-acyl-sn-glycerol-3-phosphate acyltransferase
VNAVVSRSAALVPAIRTSDRADVPRISQPLLALFSAYSSYYLRKHFRAIYLSGEALQLAPHKPVVIYLNHASWWDPLVCLLLSNHFTRERLNYAPIDSESLEQFRFFARLGFFGVQKNSRRGAINFLHTASAVLQNDDAVLWVTPQGEFVDQRIRPLALKNGLAELAKAVREISLVPLSIDYFFGEHRLPSIAVRFGESVPAESLITSSREEATAHLAGALEHSQDALQSEVISKRIYESPSLLTGSSGTGGVYGFWQRVRTFHRRRA